MEYRPVSRSGWVLSAKRTLACPRNSASEELTGRLDFAASEYTPASVGPETILQLRLVEDALQFHQGDGRRKHGANHLALRARRGARDGVIVGLSRGRARLQPSIRRQQAQRHRHHGNRGGHQSRPRPGPAARRRRGARVRGSRRGPVRGFGGADAVQPRLQALERSRRHVFDGRFGVHASVNAQFLSQVLAAVRARRQMRIHSLAILLADTAVDIPGKKCRDLPVCPRRMVPIVVSHARSTGNSTAPPPKVGRYWRNFSRA